VLRFVRGYIPVRSARVEAIVGELARTRGALAHVRALLKEARASAVRWKAKADDAERRVVAANRALLGRDKEMHHQERRIEQLHARMARQEQERTQILETMRARLAGEQEKRERVTADLRDHLESAARQLAAARDQHMLIDVKLDILEGAANTLDARTRAILDAPADHDVPKPK
jgi:chromosome segregation ATPase